LSNYLKKFSGCPIAENRKKVYKKELAPAVDKTAEKFRDPLRA